LPPPHLLHVKCGRAKDGLLELVALKAVINNGINNDLSIAFPNIDTVLRPQVQVPQIINPNWLSGFVLFFLTLFFSEITKKKLAEGCFSVVVFKNKTSKLGEAIKFYINSKY